MNSRIFVSSDGLTTPTSANSSIALGTAYVVIVTRTNATPGLVNIYLNGILSGSADQDSGNPTAGTPTYIGNSAALTTGFDGDIDEVGIYNSILSATQIAQLNTSLRNKWGI
jgi:hypothetical protein